MPTAYKIANTNDIYFLAFFMVDKTTCSTAIAELGVERVNAAFINKE